MMDIVNANVTELISMSSNGNATNLVVETSIMPHRECDISVSCEDEFIECETVGMYAMC